MEDRKRKAIDDTSSVPAGTTGDSTKLLLRVGNSVFETTTQVLFGREEDTFFHAKLSDRWERDAFTIDRDGMLFYDVLYYLRFGDLPGGHTNSECFLDKDHLDRLKTEAEFYLLPGLTKLCDEASNPYLCFGSIGDFDDAQYTDFSANIQMDSTRYSSTLEYTVLYKFNGKSVECFYEAETEPDTFDIKIYDDNHKLCVDSTSFCKIFRELQSAISSGGKTVSEAMGKVEIAPEARLFFAFVVDRMIDCYAWDFEFGDDPLIFLYRRLI